MLDAARSRAARAGIPATLVEGRIERLPFADATFDVVSAIAVLCFVSHVRAAPREMARVLRPGGALVIGELGRWSLWAATRRCRGWLARKPGAARFRSASELRGFATDAGLSVVGVRRAVFYPPSGAAAGLMAPIDPVLARMTTFGAAFVALKAVKTEAPRVCA